MGSGEKAGRMVKGERTGCNRPPRFDFAERI
jgi:hypothetical protein